MSYYIGCKIPRGCDCDEGWKCRKGKYCRSLEICSIEKDGNRYSRYFDNSEGCRYFNNLEQANEYLEEIKV